MQFDQGSMIPEVTAVVCPKCRTPHRFAVGFGWYYSPEDFAPERGT
jgi:hypothetical protein